jgi:hypothetical protein
MEKEQRAFTYHCVERKSPKGESFIGTCYLCGEVGLTIKDIAIKSCPNPRNVSQDDSLLLALRGN